jgi:transposase
MNVLYPRCAGLDVHKKTVVAITLPRSSGGTRIVPGPDGQPQKEIATFGTTTHELLRLADWLAAAGITHVAMESTGVYWKPVWNLLESAFELLLVNAAHIKQVPGHQTDVKDSEWLADLLRHGLLRASFVPARGQRELRELIRYRSALVRERAAEVNRVEKVLEGANIKLASVASDIDGVSGRQILAALVAGQTEAAELAQLAKGKLRAKIPELEVALVGQFGAHQRFLVAQQLAHLDALEATLAALATEIARRCAAGPPPPAPGGESPGVGPERPTDAPTANGAPPEAGPAASFEAAVGRLTAIPGVGRLTAEKLVGEIGIDMGQFPTAGHLASWAGLCPGQHESAGKRQSGRTRKGSRWLRAALVEAAHAAGRSQGTYLGAQYRRLAARRGAKRAAVAVGHSILVIAYHLLKQGVPFEELGAGYFDARNHAALRRQLVQRLERLGCKVTIEQPLAA